MKLLGLMALGVVPIVKITLAQVTGGSERPSSIRAGITTFAEEGISDVGVAEVHEIAPEDEHVVEELIEQLEADGQATGETPCPLGR